MRRRRLRLHQCSSSWRGGQRCLAALPAHRSVTLATGAQADSLPTARAGYHSGSSSCRWAELIVVSRSCGGFQGSAPRDGGSGRRQRRGEIALAQRKATPKRRAACYAEEPLDSTAHCVGSIAIGRIRAGAHLLRGRLALAKARSSRSALSGTASSRRPSRVDSRACACCAQGLLMSRIENQLLPVCSCGDAGDFLRAVGCAPRYRRPPESTSARFLRSARFSCGRGK